jgi:hypothetical protein
MLFALTTDSAKSTALIGLVVVVVLAVVAALVIKAIVTKVLSLVVAAIMSFGLYSQRSSIQDCANKVKKEALTFGTAAKAECTFLGVKVKVPVDKIKKP